MMGNHRMGVPRIGGNPGQVMIMPGDTLEKGCTCGGAVFRTAVRLRILPAVSPKNPTGKDQLLKVEVYLCETCGKELGNEAANAQTNDQSH